MDSAQWTKIKETFSAVAELPLDERAAILQSFDPVIRDEVEKLLAANESAGDFIASPIHVENGHSNFADEAMLGREIDDYVILEKLGEGGMGTVYLAEHRGQEFSQRVALKLIKRGMDTNAVLKRFFIERQILASLEHPNIAHLLDGGSTEDGLPYFVMELVEGENIREFCDEHFYDTNERLQLFQKVCGAISHAHQKLVVHRDIKPSNIVVTDSGEPKLLDFGIAKLLSPDWDATTTAATATNFRLMTPEYASPEQLRGQMTTTATDVYSLGVVLYELLTGARPYKFTSKDPFEISREILTIEPPRPSSVVSGQWSVVSNGKATHDNNRSTAKDQRPKTENQSATFRIPHSAFRTLKGDLDNIILKAIRKDPKERYKSVEELADDIDRYLSGLPVRATADSLTYRFKKFVARNRVGSAVAALILLLLGAAGWQAIVATRERARADERFNQVRKLANLVLFEYQDGIQKLPGSIAIREKMVADGAEYLDNLAAENSSDLTLQIELAKAYDRLGDVKGNFFTASIGNALAAREFYSKALAIKEKMLNENPNDENYIEQVAVSYDKLGDTEFGLGNQSTAVENYQKAVNLRESILQRASDNRNVRFRLMKGYRNIAVRGRNGENTEESMTLCQKALGMSEEILRESPETVEYLEGHGDVIEGVAAILETSSTRRPEAIEAYKNLIELRRQHSAKYPNNVALHQKFGMAYSYLGDTYFELNDLPHAIENYRKSLEVLDPLGMQDPLNEPLIQDKANIRSSYAYCLAKQGNTTESFESFTSIIRIFEDKYAKDETDKTTHFRIAMAKEGLAITYDNIANLSSKTKAEKIVALEKAIAAFNESHVIYKIYQTRDGAFPSINVDVNAAISEVTQAIEICRARLDRLQ
ncbi:MAG: protein kinase [Pyrinomonadaceae bacterium]